MQRILTGFGFASTAAEVTAGLDFSGKRVLVTGGASGIGIETVRTFANIGADVTMAVRDTKKAYLVAEELMTSTRNDKIHVAEIDLANRKTIGTFIGNWRGPLDVLVNNAGVMALPDLERTAEGWERQFATNYLGHFALTLGLHGALAQTGNARIVTLSSSAHLLSPVMFDDLHFNFVPYNPLLAYGQSKTATVLFAVEASRRWAVDGITANAVMPGAIATNLQRHTGGLRTPVNRQKSPQQGAATTLFVATSPQLERVGGRYFEDVNEAVLVEKRSADYTGVAPYALDAENARRLWDVSTNLIS